MIVYTFQNLYDFNNKKSPGFPQDSHEKLTHISSF